MAGSKRSIMPEGFEKLPTEDLVNLLEFLAARGRYFPLPLDKAATAVSTVGMFYDHAATAERLIFSDWKPRTLCDVPFYPIDPQGDRVRNVVLLYGPQGTFPPQMPRSVSVPCNAPAKAIHLLSGVSGWGFPLGDKGSLTMTVRLVYADKLVEGSRTAQWPALRRLHTARGRAGLEVCRAICAISRFAVSRSRLPGMLRSSTSSSSKETMPRRRSSWPRRSRRRNNGASESCRYGPLSRPRQPTRRDTSGGTGQRFPLATIPGAAWRRQKRWHRKGLACRATPARCALRSCRA